MATADQLKALLKSHFGNNDERFKTIALQLAAYEANNGHRALAQELKSIIDKGVDGRVKNLPVLDSLPDIIHWLEPKYRLSSLIVSEEIKIKLKRLLKEHKQVSKLQQHGLSNRRKVLLSGPPGTGKTMTAEVIANELKLPLNIILVDKMVTKYMGETASKLRQVFDVISKTTGVYLFDEFDALGTERSRDNEVGEMRRVLNSFLQFLEQDQSNSFIIAATNNIKLLDQALFRRFDDILFYDLPSKHDAIRLIENKLATFKTHFSIDKLTAKELKGLSHAELTQVCNDVIKEMILANRKAVKKADFITLLNDKREVYLRK